MSIAEWVPIIVSAVATLLGALALWRNSQVAGKQANTEQNATAINGYSKLMDDLQQEIERLRLRIDALEQERVQWRHDRAEMECRIRKLEEQLAKKERELAELKARGATA